MPPGRDCCPCSTPLWPTHDRGYRLMAQTSLGEILRPIAGTNPDQRQQAFTAINSKRLDFAIFDRLGHLVAAIEYLGKGHCASHSFMRDAVKRAALRKAGVPFIELPADITETSLRSRLAEALPPTPQPRPNTQPPAQKPSPRPTIALRGGARSVTKTRRQARPVTACTSSGVPTARHSASLAIRRIIPDKAFPAPISQ